MNKKTKVLIVEDETPLAMFMVSVLTRLHCDVTVAQMRSTLPGQLRRVTASRPLCRCFSAIWLRGFLFRNLPLIHRREKRSR